MIFHSCATVGLGPTVAPFLSSANGPTPHPNRPNTQQCANSWSCRFNPNNLNRRVVLPGNRLPQQFADKPARDFLGFFSLCGLFFFGLFGAALTLHPERHRRLSPSSTDLMSEIFTGAGKASTTRLK